MLPVVGLVLSLALATSAVAQTIYRWVDAEGTVHFGSEPPKGVDATLVNTSAPPGGLGVAAEDIRGTGGEATAQGTDPNISYAEQQRRERAERQQEARQKQAERQSKCAAMENQRAALEPSPRVIIEDENGNPVRMDDNDRLTRLEEAKKYLTDNCR
jgi:hypothetical protein